MKSDTRNSGGFAGELADAAGDPPAGEFSSFPPAGGLSRFDGVEERLIEAVQTLAALPDRERGWLSTRTMGLWREVVPERVDVDCEPSPARPGVSRHEYQRMEEALGWCAWVQADSRRLVGRVLVRLAAGREPDWPAIRRDLGEIRTTEALRKAYGRAITTICNRLNRSRGMHFA